MIGRPRERDGRRAAQILDGERHAVEAAAPKFSRCLGVAGPRRFQRRVEHIHEGPDVRLVARDLAKEALRLLDGRRLARADAVRGGIGVRRGERQKSQEEGEGEGDVESK